MSRKVVGDRLLAFCSARVDLEDPPFESRFQVSPSFIPEAKLPPVVLGDNVSVRDKMLGDLTTLLCPAEETEVVDERRLSEESAS